MTRSDINVVELYEINDHTYVMAKNIEEAIKIYKSYYVTWDSRDAKIQSIKLVHNCVLFNTNND